MDNSITEQGSLIRNAVFQDFIDCAKGKEVILFGGGHYALIANKLLKQYGINIAYAVDNNFWKSGTCIDGIKIFTLEKLIYRASYEDICVLICADDIFGIEHQLQQLGIKHYFALLLFYDELYKNNHTIYAKIPPDAAMSRNNASIDVMIINQCNLRCPMCRFAQNSTGEIMSIEQYSHVLNLCRDLRIMGNKVEAIRLDGNREALLHPNFFGIASETKQKGFDAFLATNGVLLSKETAAIITECFKLVHISITGITPETYHRFQGSNRSGKEVPDYQPTIHRGTV